MKTKTVFKVVERRANGALISFNNPDCESSDDGSVLHYSTGLVTVPEKRCGDLCAFASLVSAQNFVRKMGRPERLRPWEIWRAQGAPSSRMKAFNRVGGQLVPAAIPRGTRFMRTLTLTKHVETIQG